jgi:hypothetical protein
MDEAARAHLAALEDEVRAAALSEAGQHTARWCLGQLLPQYDQYRQTRESRYGEEITRLVRGLLKGITEGPGGGPCRFSTSSWACRDWSSPCPSHRPVVHERRVKRMKKRKGRRKVGRKKRRMRSKIRHRK